MNLGEAAAMLVLEELSHARRRGAKIYAEIAGYGVRCEAHHPTAPEPEGQAMAELIQDALRAARISADDVDHVNAHGTATPQNDQAEARGMRLVFGERARSLPVTSIKSRSATASRLPAQSKRRRSRCRLRAASCRRR